ncbi:MAG TPA: SDR family NAD(P)-dependent oxidoreductase, partial [Nocardioides sp.]
MFLAAKAAVSVMKAQGGGNIVVTRSASSLVAYPHFISYTASKHGVNGLVKVLSLELGRFGIRINARCPMHGMSVNLALPPDAEVLGKSYEQMGEWGKDAAAMPLRCRCDAAAMPLRCRCDAAAMPLRCRCDAAAMPLR